MHYPTTSNLSQGEKCFGFYKKINLCYIISWQVVVIFLQHTQWADISSIDTLYNTNITPQKPRAYGMYENITS